MYFWITLDNKEVIPLTIQSDDPTDEEVLELFRRSIPQFSTKKRYVATNSVGDCIIYEDGAIVRVSDSG